MVKLGNVLVVNMTPHTINWVKDDGEVVKFPSNGRIIVRVDEEEVDVSIPLPTVKISYSPYVEIELENITRITCLYSEVGKTIKESILEELLEGVDTIVVIVSSVALQVVQNYEEVNRDTGEIKRVIFVAPDTSPAGAVRDDEGKIVGVKRFVVAQFDYEKI